MSDKVADALGIVCWLGIVGVGIILITHFMGLII